ncbi:MAG: D-alanyl-D-alanine carboxypeptidase/D-alanyl-D-alanine-endopeptidase [Nitrospinae bacterium]|nr:D-alanyl-D-alanine carboxypeptidase/D-alanyl-D-alanine-endopeptidase [Nitrospinota bacterium]
MKKIFKCKCSVALLFFVLAFPAFAAENPSTDVPKEAHADFTAKINSVLSRACLKSDSLGIYIVSLKDENTNFTLNGDKLFVPASNVKLITSAAALKYFGSNYRFTTNLYKDGVEKGNILEGNLYLKGFGDPLLVSEEMWLMAKDLKNAGIQRITGDFFVDDSYFDEARIGNGWGKNPGAQAYNARVGATSLNFNTITVYVSPGDQPGSPPKVITDPETEYIKIDNTAETVQPGKGKMLIVNRVPGENFDTITVRGKISTRAERQRFYLNISYPQFFTAKAFRESLKERGIQIDGETRFGTTPENASLLVEHKSKPLSFIVRGLNKYSNNFTAEQLLKTMGAVAEGPPGTFQKGLNQVSNYLEGLGIPRGNYVLEDGSGLSRLNRVTPKQLVTVLKDAYSDFKMRPEYLASLSIMGVDGSVEKRFKGDEEIYYRTRVKTGTLNGASALSGYVSAKNEEEFAFSILVNYKNGCYGTAHEVQDNIVKEIAKWTR